MTALTPSLFHLQATSQPNPFQEDGQRRAIHQEFEIIRHAAMRQLPVAAEAQAIPVYTKILFPCHYEACSDAFVSRPELNKHLLKVHGLQMRIPDLNGKWKEEKPHPCPLRNCQSGFSYEQDLITHLKETHPKWKGYAALFTKEEGLLLQLANPYPCPMPGCHKSYDNRKSLGRHVGVIHGKSITEAIDFYKASIKVD